MTNLYVDAAKAKTGTPKVEIGDKVKVTYEGKVAYVSPYTDLFDLEIPGRDQVSFPIKDATIVEKKLPPEPKVGSTILYAENEIYVRQANGWHGIGVDGKPLTYANTWSDFRRYDGTFPVTVVKSAKY